MFPVSEKFLSALTTSHHMRVSVSAYYDDVETVPDVWIVDGDVHVDAGSEIRRTLSLSIPNPADFPTLETDPYSVYGQQLFVQRGITYLDGSHEMVPLGFFVIDNISGDVHQGPLTISAASRESLIKAQPFEGPTSTSGLAHTRAFVQREIQAVLPGADVVDTSTYGTLPIATATWDTDADRWAAIREAAASIGAEVFEDVAGTFRMRDRPDPDTATPVWSVNAGERGVMVSADRSLTSDGVVNRVIARGENTADDVPPISSTASITDPTDPLRYGGPFGRRTHAYSSQLITSATKADSAARAELIRRRAPNASVDLTAIPNPALDAGDCIRVVYGNGRPPELHIVQKLTIPLDVAGVLSIGTVSGREVG